MHAAEKIKVHVIKGWMGQMSPLNLKTVHTSAIDRHDRIWGMGQYLNRIRSLYDAE